MMSKLLDRKWTLMRPDTDIHQILVSPTPGKMGSETLGNVSFANNNYTASCLGDEMMKGEQDRCFYVVRDDLLHPLINGNKARKLDALFPLLEQHSVTDVVSL